MYLSNRDGYKKQGSPCSVFQYDKDFMNVKTVTDLKKLLDLKAKHYLYFIPRKFIIKNLQKEWEYRENILWRIGISIVAWQKKDDNTFYVAVKIDSDFEVGFLDCFEDKYKRGLALTWEYTPSPLHELLWMSHSHVHTELDWKTKEGIADALIMSMNWIAFYNSLDRDLTNYRYYNEVKRSIALNLDEKAVIESIHTQRREYIAAHLPKNREASPPP